MSSHSLIPIKKKRGRKRKSLFAQQTGHEQKIQPHQTSHKPISHFIKIPHNPDIQYAFHKISDLVDNLLDSAALLLQSNGIKNPNKHYHSSIMKLILPPDMLAYLQHVQYSRQFKQEALNIMVPKSKFDQNNASTKYDENENESKYNYTSKNSEYNQTENQEENSKLNYNHQYSEDDEEMELSQMYSNKNYEGNQQKRKRRKKKTFFDLELEKQLCDWVKQQTSLGAPVTVEDFTKQAKYLAKHRSFSASTGWCRNFFDRYPNIKQVLSRKINQPIEIKKVTFNFASQINDKNQISFSQKVRQSEAHQLQLQSSQEVKLLKELNSLDESDMNIQDESNIYAQPRKKKKSNQISQRTKKKLTDKLRQVYQQTKFQRKHINNSQNKAETYNRAKDIFTGLEQNDHQSSMQD